jgi:Ca-activated chloride channel family protein
MSCNIFKIYLDVDKKLVSREGKTGRILEASLHTPMAAEGKSRPALNLAIVLDRSGSMQGEKLEYVKQAASHVLDQLTEQDMVSLVVYDDSIQVLARSLQITNSNRFEMKRLLSGIRAGSMTNLGDGWLTGCKQIASSIRDGTINRTLLLTDGLANVGETDLEVLAQHAYELYKDSISTSTFGVGEGFNEHLLEAMANKGNGNFYYIAKPESITEIFLKEFNDLVGIAAQKVEIRIDLPSSVEWTVLGGWAAEYKDGHLNILVGDMLAGKTQEIYVKLEVPGDDKATELALTARVFGKDVSGGLLESQADLTFVYASQQDVEAAPVNQGLMERFSLVEMADLATESLKLEREGPREAAYVNLQDSVNRNRPNLPSAEAQKYEDMSRRMRTWMTEADRKSSHWKEYNIKRKKEHQEDS